MWLLCADQFRTVINVPGMNEEYEVRIRHIYYSKEFFKNIYRRSFREKSATSHGRGSTMPQRRQKNNKFQKTGNNFDIQICYLT